jgi:carbamate kinase
MRDKIVVALGGNALGKTPQEQINLVKNTAKPIVDLIQHGHQVTLAHGNGPQVGMINLAMDTASKTAASTPEMPFPECGAMSQGYIGYHLQNAIREEMLGRNISKPVATVVTQVIVDKNDEAFVKPTKPIGAFYTEEEAQELITEKGFDMVEDAGRGYRRVVPSPLPIDVAEKEVVKTLVDNDCIVITVGGGGIPVVKDGNKLIGVPAVIDKDFASSKIAEILDADYLIILTAVEKVAINFGTKNEKWLDKLTLEEAQQYIDEGHFAPGSMLPKVKAAMMFASSKKGRKALITSLEKAEEGIEGKTGTLIINE